jgi:Abnormal spindle-like microcephaly-assoc'd, ASPM-SPD-2-Hydin
VHSFNVMPLSDGSVERTNWRNFSMVRNRIFCSAVAGLLLLMTSFASAQYAGQFAWGTSNYQETTLTPQNVGSGQFGKAFSFPVDGPVFAQPLYMPNVAISGQGTHNVVLVVTESDGIYAFDADGKQTAPLWYVSLINPAQGITAPNCYSVVGPCNIYPTIGITSTPAIDPVSGTMYVEAMTLESGTYFHRLHAIDITSGAEKFGGPAVIQASGTGKGLGNVGGVITFVPQHEVNRPGLLLMNGVVYIGYGGAAHGWLMGYNATTLAQLYVLLLSPNSYASGIWQTGEGLQTDGLGNIFFATDDAPFDANAGTKDDYGDTLMKLSGSLAIEDYFTPMEQACRSAQDLDLGSAGPLLLPTQNGATPNELIIAGKGGTPCDLWADGTYEAPIYVVNRDNLGKYNATQDQVLQEVEGAPHGYWSNTSYWAGPSANYFYAAGVDAWGGSGDFIKQFTVTNGLLSTTPVAMSTNILPVGGTPVISSNSNTDGVLWIAERQQSLSTLPGADPLILFAYDATNVATQLYSSAAAGTKDQAGLATKFEVPLVANGRVYVGTQTEVDVYGIPPAANVSPTSLNFSLVPIGNVSAAQTATLTNSGSTALSITSITATGEFAKSATTCGSSLGANSSCTISVTFNPTSDGAQTGTLSVVDGAGTQTVALSGTATPLKFTPASVNFGTVKVGTTSAVKKVTVQNVSSGTITISSIAVGGTDPGDFAQTNTCGKSLAAGKSCVVSATFTPAATGVRSGNVTVKDTDPTSPQKILLSGTGD